MYKFFAAIVLSLIPALLPLSAASFQETPIPVTENPSPEIDATTQKWLDRLQHIATHRSDPSEKVHIWLGLADLYINTYSDRQQGEAAITQAITTARSIPDPASKAQTLIQITQFPDLEPSTAATLLDLSIESISAIADESQQQYLLAPAIDAATKWQASIQLSSSVQPLTLVEQIQDPYLRKWWRVYVIEVQARKLIAQKQMAAAIELIETMPLHPNVFQETIPPQTLTSDPYLLAKIDQVDLLLAYFYLPPNPPTLATSISFPLTELDLTQILPPLHTTVQGWLNRIQDPYIKAQGQTRWIRRLNRLGQVQESGDLYQEFLQSLPNQPFSPRKKAQLLLPFLQYSWESNPQTQPLIQQTIQTFQTQLNAIGNTESDQKLKANLLQNVILSTVSSPPQPLAALADSANTLSNLKWRSGLLYNIASRYESNGQKSEANAIYNQILPILDHLEDQSQAVVILLKLGQTEAAMERARKNGTDSVLYEASVTLIEQELAAPALELVRLIQSPTLKARTLAQASATLSNRSQRNAFFQETIVYLQTLSGLEQQNAIYEIGRIFNDTVPLQILDSLEPDLQVILLLGMVENYGRAERGDTDGWTETQYNNRIAQRLAQLMPHITQLVEKDMVLMTLVSLDAADHPDRVSQWIDQVPPNAQARALFRAIYLRSHSNP
jgi:tetratricopeptide (TPR) repeat protein